MSVKPLLSSPLTLTLTLTQWCTAQCYPHQKMASSSKTFATATLRQPAAYVVNLIMTFRAPASDCARLMAPGQGPPPAAQVRMREWFAFLTLAITCQTSVISLNLKCQKMKKFTELNEHLKTAQREVRNKEFFGRS